MSEPTEVRADPDAAEDFAEEVGVDPTQEEIDHYRELEGKLPLAEAGEEADPGAALPDPSVS